MHQWPWRFYSQVLNVPVESKGGVQQLTLSAGQQLAIYQPSKQRPQPAQHGRLALCLPSANLERSLEQALAQGASALEAIRQESFGARCGSKIPRAIACCCWSGPDEQHLARPQRRLPRL